jgi:hypothetical protein
VGITKHLFCHCPSRVLDKPGPVGLIFAEQSLKDSNFSSPREEVAFLCLSRWTQLCCNNKQVQVQKQKLVSCLCYTPIGQLWDSLPSIVLCYQTRLILPMAHYANP